MAELTFKSKKEIRAGNYEYTYSCFCRVPLPLQDIVVVAGNDGEARQLAQLECDEHCEGA